MLPSPPWQRIRRTGGRRPAAAAPPLPLPSPAAAGARGRRIRRVVGNDGRPRLLPSPPLPSPVVTGARGRQIRPAGDDELPAAVPARIRRQWPSPPRSGGQPTSTCHGSGAGGRREAVPPPTMTRWERRRRRGGSGDDDPI